MDGHANADLYRRYVEAVNARDPGGLAPLLAEDVTWWEPGGQFRIEGRDALLQQMQRVVDGLDVTFVLHDVLANDEHTVGLLEARFRAGDRELVARTTEVWHVTDGVVAQRWLFADDTQAFVDFFAALAGD